MQYENALLKIYERNDVYVIVIIMRVDDHDNYSPL